MTIEQTCIDLLSEPDQYFYHKTFQRHLDDLKRFEGSEKYRFKENIATAYITVIESMHHYKGELAGKNLILESWQRAVIGILSGWEKTNDNGEWVRRFNTALIFVARKNGKSLFASAFTVADALLRGEIGNEVIFCASKRDQAKLCWDGVDKIMDYHSEFRQLKSVAYSTITLTANDTTFKTLGRDSKSEDGANCGVAIMDELHAHPDSSIYDIVASSMGARKQPIILIITTAGFNLESPLQSHHIHSQAILNGTTEDDNYFAFVAEPDLELISEDENYKFSIEALRASNPNMGVSIKDEFLRQQAIDAKKRPDLLNNYLVKHLNLFVAQEQIYIPLDRWKQCRSDEVPDLKHALYKFIGLDLSLSDDFTSKCCLYMFEKNRFYVTTHHYIPEKSIDEQARKLRVPLRKWVNEGYITATKGDTIDADYIYQDIKKDIESAGDAVVEIGYDPNRAKYLISKIENDLGFKSNVKVVQSPYVLTEPTKLLLDLVKRREITYENNPVTTWHVSNMSVDIKPDGRMIPDKSSANRKIDGVASIIDALALALYRFDEMEQNLFAMF